jgi:hypothetical protein
VLREKLKRNQKLKDKEFGARLSPLTADAGMTTLRLAILHSLLSFSHQHRLHSFLFAEMRFSGEIWILIGLESDLESIQAVSMVGHETPSVADPDD